MRPIYFNQQENQPKKLCLYKNSSSKKVKMCFLLSCIYKIILYTRQGSVVRLL